MFCPECKAEYREGFTKCGDCDIELIDALVLDEPEPERGDNESREFFSIENPVEIERFLHIHQAEFAVSVLEGSSINAYIDQAFTGNIAPHFMLMTGGVRLFVQAQDEERALEILRSAKELNQGEIADQEDDFGGPGSGGDY